MFFNMGNSFDVLRHQIQIVQNIKSKLIRCGILYDEDKLVNYYYFLPESNYLKTGNINKTKDTLLIIAPTVSMDKERIGHDIDNAFIQYLIYYAQEASKNLSSEEYEFYINPINAKLLYNAEFYNMNIVIVRI